MRVRIEKGTAFGKIKVPSSKSVAHRLLISAALSEGKSVIRDVPFCEDVLATIDCLKALGIKTEICGSDVTVWGRNIKEVTPEAPLMCRESGSTIRFMLPIAMLTGKEVIFKGAEGLMKRPMTVYEDLFSGKFQRCDDFIRVSGGIDSGSYSVAGNISSQFISGLLFALVLAGGDSVINIIPPVESRSYIDLTIGAMKQFNVDVKWIDECTLGISGNQKYSPADVTVEGDFSGAAFPDALNFLGGNVEVDGLNPNSMQGDRVYKEHFAALDKGYTTIDLKDCPDLAPVLFALAAAKNGGTFTGTARLKIKESDRADTMAKELEKFGASVTVREDSVTVEPAALHKPTECINGHNDHRIVMATAILLTLTGGEIEGAQAISKSYPAFFEDLRSVGIGVREI